MLELVMTPLHADQNPAVLLKPLDKLRAFQVYTLYTLFGLVHLFLHVREAGDAGLSEPAMSHNVFE